MIVDYFSGMHKAKVPQLSCIYIHFVTGGIPLSLAIETHLFIKITLCQNLL